jgi:hypothetical protein
MTVTNNFVYSDLWRFASAKPPYVLCDSNNNRIAYKFDLIILTLSRVSTALRKHASESVNGSDLRVTGYVLM